MTLYPTPTRLALLRDVYGGWVVRRFGVDIDVETDRVVSARIAELERAGWVELGQYDRWQLTDAGRGCARRPRRQAVIGRASVPDGASTSARLANLTARVDQAGAVIEAALRTHRGNRVLADVLLDVRNALNPPTREHA